VTDAPDFARLVDTLGGLFDATSMRRGVAYARANRVKLDRVDSEHALAVVRGESGVYETAIQFDSKRGWEATCSCPRFNGGLRCKHLWALVVTLDGAGWRFEGIVDGQLRNARLVQPSVWRSRLAMLRTAAPSPSSNATPARPERLFFVLRLDLCIDKNAIVIETRMSSLRKKDGWSTPTPFAVFRHRRGEDSWSEGDRQILAILKGAAEQWDLEYKKTFALDAIQGELLLPRMAESGSLHWSDGLHKSPRPIAYDGDERWHLYRRLREDGPAGEVVIEGEWRRSEQVVALDKALALLPGGFILFEDRIGRIAADSPTQWARSLEREGPIRVPASDKAELLRELTRTGEEIELDGVLRTLRRDVVPRARMTIDAPLLIGDQFDDLTAQVAFEYDGVSVQADDVRALIEHGAGWIARDGSAEQALAQRPLVLGARALSERPGALVMPLSCVADMVRTLTAEGWVVEGEGARYRQGGAAKWSLKSGIDWFDLTGEVTFDGTSAPLPALITALRRNQRTLLLGDGTIGVLPEEWLARYGALTALGKSQGDVVRFKNSQVWLLDSLLAEQDAVQVDERYREQLQRLRQFKSVEPASEPAGFRGELRPYQRDGLGWLEFLERQCLGGCLADDMGLGKTIQVLAWLLARRARRTAHAPTLVVAPKSLTHNWIAEAHRFAPQLSTLDYTGTTRRSRNDDIARHDIVVTTYGTLRNDIEHLGDEQFDCIVLDEAQAIKNADSLTAKAARLLQAEHRIALSGTPIENHLGELWSLFEFLNPGMLGRSSVFNELLAAPRDQTLSSDSRTLLAKAVRPFVLRRTKEQVLRDLPQKTEQTVTCDMGAEQRREYDELKEHYRRILLSEVGDAAPDSFTVLEALLRLRQAACHPGLLDRKRVGEPSAKLDSLMEMIEEVLAAGHKALVFSQFTSFLAIVQDRVLERGIVHAYLDGSTPGREREDQIRRFQEDPKCPLFLLSLKAGGVGLNLTAADYVFLLDPWWNPAVEAQAIGRAHRIGQTRSVFAYKFVCGDTIEERVIELQARKRELAAVILDGEATTLRDLTRADVERLLR
jgi:superfamily II DNA or RNA helicase